MVRLRTVRPGSKGWTRRRTGKAFSYVDATGAKVGPEDVARIKSLAIPPAWQDVWICPIHNGHIQAVGVDAAGRKQYLYHPEWRAKRDQLKFDRVLQVAHELSRTRTSVLEHLALPGMPLERAAATAVRLLDLGYFRIGSDAYTDENGSFGLTTLERRHVRRRRGTLVFDFVGKSGVSHSIVIDDPRCIEAVEIMRKRRGDDARLMAFQADGRWQSLDAAKVNDYLRNSTGGDMTAKDFRTWHATVLAAAALAGSTERGDTKRSRQRAIRQAMVEVSDYLGNTPAIAKASYVDPRVVDLYEDGVTIAEALKRSHDSAEERQQALETAVLQMLTP
ncbi:MAG TPA: DNA topoisomerase IB [Nocardioidaceae bacterium]|nr:DNA topoisomerase IB [Nocardioidaceae bacterium]